MRKILLWLFVVLLMILCIIDLGYGLASGTCENPTLNKVGIGICSFAFVCNTINLIIVVINYVKNEKQ